MNMNTHIAMESKKNVCAMWFGVAVFKFLAS